MRSESALENVRIPDNSGGSPFSSPEEGSIPGIASFSSIGSRAILTCRVEMEVHYNPNRLSSRQGAAAFSIAAFSSSKMTGNLTTTMV